MTSTVSMTATQHTGRPILEVVNLTKIYAAGTEAVTYALQDASFKIYEGEFVAIIGPSGSGKSTMLNLIGALDRPTSGKVIIDGVDLSRLSSADLARVRNGKIGFVFQSFNLISRITAVENVEVPLLVSDMSATERRKRALKLLGQLGLASKANKRPVEMSGGEQQRVAVARSLATDPAIVLGDEPTGNLDTRNTDLVMNILQDLSKTEGKTLIIITHNLDVAKRAQKVVSLRDGRVESIREN